MNSSDAFALLAIIVALVSAYISRIQTQKANEANELSLQISRSAAVMHFTDRFFELLKDANGEISKKLIEDTGWEYQFWSLQATEFYFFHHGTLPAFMYKLWMVDLAALYQGSNGQVIREKHKKYLDKYSLGYRQMNDFFDQLYATSVAKSGINEIPSKRISDMVDRWINHNITHRLD